MSQIEIIIWSWCT